MSTSLPLLIGGSGLIRGRVRNFGRALAELSYEIGDEIKAKSLLTNAPFDCISMIVRYGHEALKCPEVGRINSHRELEVSVQASLAELQAAAGDVPKLKLTIEPYVRRAISAVAEKFELAAYNN